MIQNEKIEPRRVPDMACSPPLVPFVPLQAAAFSEQVPAFVGDPTAPSQQLVYVMITLEWDNSDSMKK